MKREAEALIAELEILLSDLRVSQKLSSSVRIGTQENICTFMFRTVNKLAANLEEESQPVAGGTDYLTK